MVRKRLSRKPGILQSVLNLESKTNSMRNFIKNIIFKGHYCLLATLVVFTACNDDFLKDELLSDTSVEFLYSTPEGLESAVVGLYSLNREIYQDQRWN